MQDRPRVDRECRQTERGVASLLAVVGMSLILLGVMMTMRLIEMSSRSIGGQLRYHGQAFNAAAAGSADALAWFQSQTTQPVTSFSPQRNLAASPPINDTESTAIGIVRTYPLSDLGNVWGRYEVRSTGVVDVSQQRGKSGNGTIWQFDSFGMVFMDKNGNSQMDWTDANGNAQFDWGETGEVIALKRIRSEVQRLSLVLPGGNAALQSSTCSGTNLSSGGSQNRVLGSAAGVGLACKNGTGSPNTTGATVTGNPAIQTNVNPYNDSIPSVFGVSQAELVSLASLAAPNVAGLPQPLPPMSLIVIQGNATFTTSHPLVGSGILVVLGNLVIPANSESSWNGVIYTTGTYAQNGPSLVLGAIVSVGGITMSGTSDITEVDWDPTVVQIVRNALGGYRYSRSQYLIPS